MDAEGWSGSDSQAGFSLDRCESSAGEEADGALGGRRGGWEGIKAVL